MTDSRGDYIAATVNGDVTGQFAAGKNIAQTNTVLGAGRLDDHERAQLEQLFSALKQGAAAEAPAEQRATAVSRVDELEAALTADQPDLDRVEDVKRWFLKRLPNLLGLVTGILVHPIVGKLVQSAGDAAVADLHRLAQE